MMFVEYLLNEGVPKEFHFSGVLDKKSLVKHLTRIAKDKPDIYPSVVSNVKRVGDMLATFEGISVGLDDITPDYKERDKLMDKTEKDIKGLKDEKEVVRRLLQAQSEGLALGTKHKGSLQRQVESGSRGKPGQFLKTVFSPVVAKGPDDSPQPYLIKRSYAEGLTPGEYWLTAGEARRETAMVQLSTALPGETSKVITSVMNNVLVTKPDCGTKNGLDYDIDDHHILDRYEAGTNRLIDTPYVRDLKARKVTKIKVRSPLTCLESPGVCQKCYGKNNQGELHDLGTNIGLRAAHSMSEPLTQMVLSAKHGGMMAREQKPELIGARGFRQLVSVPEIFKDEAVLSQKTGKVTKIEKSPQGGFNVHVDDTSHYVNPKRKLLVWEGQSVDMGDQLSDGIPNPKSVVALQGLGAGRKYMTDTIHDIYKRSGLDIDKRHVELFVKQNLNHVKVTSSDPDGQFVRGDVVPYNSMRDHLMENSKEMALSDKLVGQRLGQEYLHFAAGTPITKQIHDTLKENGISKVAITQQPTTFEPIMKPIEQVPLMSTDWLSRLSHRRIKDTLLKGTAEGWSTDKKSTAPYAALTFNAPNFGKSIEQGEY